MDSNSGNKSDLPHWKSIQHKLSLIKSDSQYNLVITEYKRLGQTLAQLNTCSDLKDHFTDPSAQKFFFEELLPAAARAILQSKVKYTSEAQDVLDNCLKQMIQLWLRTFSDLHRGLFEMAEAILDPTQPYYNHHSSGITINPNMNEDHNKTEIKNEKKLSFFEQLLDTIKLAEPKIFDQIYEMLTDTKNIPSITKMILLCSIAGNLSLALPQDSARDYIKKIKEAIYGNLSHNAASYKDCFTEKNIKALLKSFKLLFRRQLFSNEEKHKDLDNLQLTIAKICLMSSTEKTKALGFQLIKDGIADLENPTSSQVLEFRRPHCNKFLQDLLSEMSGKGSFDQNILIYCPRVFLYLFKNTLLEAKHLRSFWVALTKINGQENSKIWFILKKVFRRSHICALLDSFIEANFGTKLGEVTNSDLKLLFNLFRETQVKSIQPLIEERLLTLYYDILLKSEYIKDPETPKTALGRLLWRKYFLPNFTLTLPTMDECINKLEQDITNFPLLRLLCQYLRLDHTTESRKSRDKAFRLLLEHMKYFGTQNLTTINESHYRALYSERLERLKALLETRELDKTSLTYETLNEVWQIFTEPPFSSTTHQDLFIGALHQIADSFYGLCLQDGDFAKLFRERILNNKEILERLGRSEEGAAWFQSFFIVANHNAKKIWKVKSIFAGRFVVKVIPEELEGYEELWNFIMCSKDKKTTDKAIEFLAQIHFKLEDQFEPDLPKIRERLVARCFEYIKSSEPGSLSGLNILKSIKLLSKVIEETGRSGLQELDAHARLGKVEIFELTIDVKNFDMTNPLKISAESNITFLELLQKIAKQLGTQWEAVILSRYSYSQEEKIPHTQNHKTLSEIGIGKYAHLKASRNTDFKKVDLLRDYDTFSQRAITTFKKLFESYSDDGKMSIEQYAASIQQRYILPNHSYLKTPFSQFDEDRDGSITLDEFLKLQLAQYKENSSGVRQNLIKHKVRNDLREEADIARQQADKRSLISDIILSNEKYLDILLSLLDCEEEEIAYEAWNLLNRLPTHPQLLKDLVMLKGVREIEDPLQRDWNALLSLKSKYRLLYVLNIVEYLMHCNENGGKIPHLEDLKLQEYQRTWLEEFIHNGRLDYFSEVFSLFKPNKSNILTYRRILSFAKAMITKLHTLLKSNEELMTKVSSFMKLASEYEHQCLTLEHNIAANLMSRSIKLLKRRKHKIEW